MWLEVMGGVGDVGAVFVCVYLSQRRGGNQIDHAAGRLKMRLILITVDISNRRTLIFVRDHALNYKADNSQCNDDGIN